MARRGRMSTVLSASGPRQPSDVLAPGADAPEEILVARVCMEDTAAFDTLFRRYRSRVFRQALHLLGNPAEAEEVAQDVFVAFYEKARTFRGSPRWRPGSTGSRPMPPSPGCGDGS